VGLPLFWLAVSALTDKAGAPSLANFEQLFTDPTLLAPLRISLIVATCVGCISTLVAAPIAWIVARSDMPARRLIRVLITASFVTPPFLGAIAWEVLAAPNSGLINAWYRAVYDLPPFIHFVDIYSIEGLIFVDSCYAFPFVFVLVANALDRIPADMEDAAAILGAPAWRIIATITLPLAFPAILAGALIAFLRSLTLFGTPAILALPAGFHTITTKIWSLFQYPPNRCPYWLRLSCFCRRRAGFSGGGAMSFLAGAAASPGESSSATGAGRHWLYAFSSYAFRCSCPISHSSKRH
jgi:iron(III) transport system permease protein